MSQAERAPGAVRLFLAGDVMTGRGVDQILPHPSDPTLYERWVKSAADYVSLAERAHGPAPRGVDPAYVWGEALEVWRDRAPDLRIVNLETAVTTSDAAEPKGINYRMHPANVGCLSAAGFDVCGLANNHVLDWGEAGLKETLATLHDRGLKTAGAGLDLEAAQAPAVGLLPGGRRVLVFAVAARSGGVPAGWAATARKPGVALVEPGPQAASELAARIERLRRPGDRVVVSIHWGSNWGWDIPDAHRRFARALIDEAGVSVVHGHSSHHVRPLELWRGRPILYGAGDFLNDYEGIEGYEEFRGDLTAMWFADFDTAGALTRLELVPMQIRRFRLQRASAADARWLAEQLAARSPGLNPRLTEDASLLLF